MRSNKYRNNNKEKECNKMKKKKQRFASYLRVISKLVLIVVLLIFTNSHPSDTRSFSYSSVPSIVVFMCKFQFICFTFVYLFFSFVSHSSTSLISTQFYTVFVLLLLLSSYCLYTFQPLPFSLSISAYTF